MLITYFENDTNQAVVSYFDFEQKRNCETILIQIVFELLNPP